MAKTIEQEMYNYFTQLNDEEKNSVVQMLKTFLQSRKKKSSRISIDQYNKEIDEAMEELRKGEVASHEEVVKMSKNW